MSPSQPWRQCPHCHPLPHLPQVPSCPRGHGSWAVVPSGWLPPSHPDPAPAASPHQLQEAGGRKAKCPHVLAGDNVPRPYELWERDRRFLQTQPCAHPSREGSGGPGALLNPGDTGITGAKLRARSILLWMVLGHLVPGRVAPALGEETCRLVCQCAMGWCASVPWAGGQWLQRGKGATTLSASPSHPKHKLSPSLGSPHLKLRRK